MSRVHPGVDGQTDPRAAPDDINRSFYGHVSAGRGDYWRKMAAPRARVEVITALLAAQAPRSLVDLGCGGAQLLGELARALPGARLAGVDLSEAQVALDRRAMPDVDFVAVDLDAPDAFDGPLAAYQGRFDAVVAMELVEHVADPAALLRNALRLAAPGARLYLSTQSGPLRETERRVGHRRHFSAGAMRSLLTDAGWRPERVWNCGFPFHDLSKRLANLAPDAAFARFDGRPYGLAEDALCLALRALFRLNSPTHGAQLFAVARRTP